MYVDTRESDGHDQSRSWSVCADVLANLDVTSLFAYASKTHFLMVLLINETIGFFALYNNDVVNGNVNIYVTNIYEIV